MGDWGPDEDVGVTTSEVEGGPAYNMYAHLPHEMSAAKYQCDDCTYCFFCDNSGAAQAVPVGEENDYQVRSRPVGYARSTRRLVLFT